MQPFKFSRLTPCVKLSYLTILSDTILWLLPASHSADAAEGRRLANQTPAPLSVACSAEETREEMGRNGEISSPSLFLRVHHSALFNPLLSCTSAGFRWFLPVLLSRARQNSLAHGAAPSAAPQLPSLRADTF